MSEDKLQVGDKVKFNGLEGHVVAIDYDVDRITVEVIERNGGTNLNYGHISQLAPILIERPSDVKPAKHEAKAKPETPVED